MAYERSAMNSQVTEKDVTAWMDDLLTRLLLATANPEQEKAEYLAKEAL